MNLAEYLVNSARNHPDKIAVRYEGRQVTFGELDADCNRLANGLKNLGLTPGDRCIVMMPNSIKSITVYYAMAKLGAVVIPVNFLYRVHELKHILTDSRPKAFIGSEPYLEEIEKVIKKIKEAPPIRLALESPKGSDFQDLEKAFSAEHQFSAYPTDDNDTFNILYTSGTTGIPKGVMLTHWNLGQNARILAGMRGTIEPNTVIIGVLPLYHIYGITSVMNVSMYLGLTIHLFPHFDPEHVIRIVEDEERTILFAVPTMLNRLIQLASEIPPKRASLKFCVSGGASLPVEFLKRFETLFNTKIHEGYGLTECPVCVENPYGKPTKPGSIGLPIPEFSARIVDENGNEVDQGENGELTIKGPGVMKGYLNLPEETKKTVKDGWLYTGDIARMDEEGYISIVDRKKDLVIRGGYNVYPREIEEVLYQIPDILEAAVFGIPQEDLGEELAAVVVLKEGAQIDTNGIRQYVKDRVAPYKYPRIIKISREPLPKGGSGKILKKEVKEEYGTKLINH
ncbi:class I adenylate-forming enzyme family protein [Thermodesulfobacteriota bacterium]